MKIKAALILAITIPSSAAFSPLGCRAVRTSLYAGVVTGPKGKPASSFEEDLLLTLKIIQDHDARSVTASKDQFISQMRDAASVPKEAKIDVSIPYDAAARLAFESSDKSTPYPQFKENYEAAAVYAVKAKRQSKIAASPLTAHVDLSIPYDAAAKLAFEKSDKSIAYIDFKEKYEANAVAEVKAKRQPKVAEKPKSEPTVDLSIPYDAAAKLAYEMSDKSLPYQEFKVVFEAKAVADVKAKRQPKVAETPRAIPQVDLSIPYDAAARLAYKMSDESIPYNDFKKKYEEDAIADVIAKKAKRLNK